MQLRRVMTILQVASAMSFASLTLAIAWQTDFAMRATPGFDPAPLLIVDVPEPAKDSEKSRRFISALKAQPGIEGIAIAEDAVGRSNNSWFTELKVQGSGASAALEMKGLSTNFFEIYRIKPVAGRLYDSRIDQEDDPVPLVLNAIAARDLGFATPEAALGKILLFTGWDGKVQQKRVIGIAPAVRFQSLREKPRAMGYILSTNGNTLTVRSALPLAQVEGLARSIWPGHFPNALPKTVQAASILAANYADEARMAKLLAVASAIALAIAAFGTYVLSAHTVQRRAREIVLRKLHGAGRRDIALLVLREIGSLTLIAAAIGLPLAAFGIQRYLATYVEHAPIVYWALLLALAATVAVALVAVARHAWQAMRMMPADVLRT